MNNKGFAISSILYTLLLIAGMFLIAILASSSFRLKLLNAKLSAIKNEIGSEKAKQYRYLTANGNWSEWIDYSNKDAIDIANFSINKIPNLGSKNTIYDLAATNISMNVLDGKASLVFDGSSSKAIKNNTYTATANVFPNTIYIEAKGNSNYLFTLGNNNHQIYFDGSNRFNIKNVSGSQNTYSTGSYSDSNVVNKFVLILNKNLGTYSIYENGILIDKAGLGTEIMSFNDLIMGYNTSGYFSGRIYKAVFSSMILSSDMAVNLSENDNTLDIFNGNNSEVIYGDFIQYRDVSIEKRNDNSKEEFSARYIRDMTSGRKSDGYNNYYEIEAYANFSSKQQFNNVNIGGTYTGTYSSSSPDKITVTSGTYTNKNAKKFVFNSSMDILLPYSASVTSYGSNLIMFIGSDVSRFPDNNSFKSFIAVRYMDKDNDNTFEWCYYNGTIWTIFTPNSNDTIVGYVAKKNDTLVLDSYQLFSYPFNYNVALGAKAVGSDNPASTLITRLNDGSVANIFSNGTNNQNVEIDLGCDYKITNVLVMRINDHIYNNAKTMLYNFDRSNSYTLYDAKESGLYKEISIGTNFYIDKMRNIKTYKTRYVGDAVNGFIYRTGVPGMTQDYAYWSEMKIYDLNDNNISIGKKATSSTGASNITSITDDNLFVIYSSGSAGYHWIEIDLESEYAVAAVQVWHYNAGGLGNNRYLYKNQETVLYNYGKNEYNKIYNYKQNGNYIELTTGFRIPTT